MDAQQTPDAVREARLSIAREAAASVFDKDDQPSIAEAIRAGRQDHISQVQAALAALDSRAGDAGEGDIELRARAIAQRVVPYEAHSSHVSARQMDRRRVAKAAARLALSATPAPAVDAVPAGEVACPTCGDTSPLEECATCGAYPTRKAALSHGEGRK